MFFCVKLYSVLQKPEVGIIISKAGITDSSTWVPGKFGLLKEPYKLLNH